MLKWLTYMLERVPESALETFNGFPRVSYIPLTERDEIEPDQTIRQRIIADLVKFGQRVYLRGTTTHLFSNDKSPRVDLAHLLQSGREYKAESPYVGDAVYALGPVDAHEFPNLVAGHVIPGAMKLTTEERAIGVENSFSVILVYAASKVTPIEGRNLIQINDPSALLWTYITDYLPHISGNF